MVYRRIGVAVLALLALVFLISSHVDSMAMSSIAKHESWAGDEFSYPHRLSGSVFSPTGDPDEIATVNPRGGGRMNGEFGDLIDTHVVGGDWLRSRPGTWSIFLHYLLYSWWVVR